MYTLVINMYILAYKSCLKTCDIKGNLPYSQVNVPSEHDAYNIPRRVAVIIKLPRIVISFEEKEITPSF